MNPTFRELTGAAPKSRAKRKSKTIDNKTAVDLPVNSGDLDSDADNNKKGNMSDIKKNQLKMIKANQLVTLKRNPQYLTPAQMDGLKKSIKRDGFCAPILVRVVGEMYEIISGNHRYMAACEMGIDEIPCVVAELTDGDAKRLAVNLNTIHGQPNAELLAPFLAEMDLPDLAEVYIEADVKKELAEWDKTLVDLLSKMDVPSKLNKESPLTPIATCKCGKCGTTHIIKI